ncbi:MAG: protein kinase [Myxococcales bacterium]|nr:protein kinase [Myxococcales bacterium]
MAGAPPDGFASGGPTAVAATLRERADDDGDFGHIDTAPVIAPAVGVTIGRYRLEALLGEGAMGQVWRARDPQLDRAVAIKVVHPAIAANPESSARLLREARAMAKLSHGNVVTVHDAGDDQGRLFVAMDLVDGVSLGARLRARPAGAARDWRGILAVFRDAGRGLIAAHAAGVLHRDFKPDNVLVDGAGRARVADFGLAVFGGRPEATRRPERPTARQDAIASDLTAAGSVLGTPAYMSPEQLRGEVIDARADQFSFCASLFEALYGEPAFLRDAPMTIAALVTAIEDGAVRPPPADDPVPRWVRAAVVRGLAADPAARWPDMRALVAALIPPRRVPPVMIGLSLGAVAVAALAVIVVLRADRSARHAPAPVEATRRFEVSLASRLAISPDGRRVALATPERIDVRELDGARTWSRFEATRPVDRVEFVDAERLRFGQAPPLGVSEWTLATDASRELWRRPDWDRWLGQLDGQDVLARKRDGRWTVGLVVGDAVRELAALEAPAPVAVGSPDGHRLALLLERRYDGQLAIVGPGGVEARSAWIPALTAVHWLDARTLIYATGTVDQPTLWAATVDGATLGPPRRLYQRARGWFGQLAVAADRVLFIDSGATFRCRVIDRRGAAASPRELDPAAVGATLAWLDEATFVTWNRASGLLERHQLAGPVGATPARLDGEVVNATRADDVIIAALRRDTGRELVAVSLTDGRELWRRPPGFGRGVRCTDDAAPPCAVIHDGEGDDQSLAWIDPRTGEVGATFGARGRVDDVALTRGGAEALIADGTRQIKRVDLASAAVTAIEMTMVPRALAADPRGGVLVTGTRVITQYVLARVDGATTEELMQSRDDLLFLPRPSPGGGAISVMGRLFLPALYELPRRALR